MPDLRYLQIHKLNALDDLLEDYKAGNVTLRDLKISILDNGIYWYLDQCVALGLIDSYSKQAVKNFLQTRLDENPWELVRGETRDDKFRLIGRLALQKAHQFYNIDSPIHEFFTQRAYEEDLEILNDAIANGTF